MTSFTCLTSVAVHRPIGPGVGFQTDSARIPCNFTCYEVNRLTDVIGMQYRSHLRVGIFFFWKGDLFIVAAFLQHMVRHMEESELLENTSFCLFSTHLSLSEVSGDPRIARWLV